MEWHDLIPLSTGSIELLCGGQDGGSETSVLLTWITKERSSQVLAPPWAPQAIRPHKPVPMGGSLLPIHHAMNRKLQLTTAKCQRSDMNQSFKYVCDIIGEETRLTTPPPHRPQPGWSSSGLHVLDIEISLALLHQICQHPGTCTKPSRKHYAWIFPFSKKEKHDLSPSLLHSDRSSLKLCMAR